MTDVPENDHPWHAAINAKLAEIVAVSSPLPSWYVAWSRLRPQSADEERLAVYKAIRAARSVPAEAGFFLVARLLDILTLDRVRDVEDRLEFIREKHDLDEDNPSELDDVPEEYREALEHAHDPWEALYVATLEEHGEHEMARLFQEDQEQFDQRYEAGRQFFHGPMDDNEAEDDHWLTTLLEAVGGCMEADSPTGPLGLRYWEEEGFWEVWIYPTPVELVGGRHDGEVVESGFALDLEQLRERFDSVIAFHWNVLGLNYPEGPLVAIEGVFESRNVFLQVLAYAPEGEEPGLKLDATQQRRRDG